MEITETTLELVMSKVTEFSRRLIACDFEDYPNASFSEFIVSGSDDIEVVIDRGERYESTTSRTCFTFKQWVYIANNLDEYFVGKELVAEARRIEVQKKNKKLLKAKKARIRAKEKREYLRLKEKFEV